MKNLMKPLLVIAVLVGLGVIGPVMDRRSSVVALRADGGPSVTIGSPLPLPVTATVTQPIQVEQAIGAGHLTGLSGIFVLYVVPAKKRLVVEHFSSDVGVAPTTPVTGYFLATANNPNDPGSASFAHSIAPAFSSPCGTLCFAGLVRTVASQPISMYVEAGQALVVNVEFGGAADVHTFGFFSVSGYLVDAL